MKKIAAKEGRTGANVRQMTDTKGRSDMINRDKRNHC